jgi:serine/threonine protein kinase
MTLQKVIADRYEILNVLGAGGIGTVYKALDLQNRNHVAVKMIDMPSAIVNDPKSRLLVEVSSLAKLNHPSISKLIDFISEDSISYIVMELVEGKPLARIDDINILIKLIKQVSEALSVVHAGNIIHRDIKPDNILVVDGENPKAVIVDFGIAKVTNSSMKLTSTGIIIGTLDYMSPEQVMGSQIDARTDLYSLGCVLYEALTGEVPFKADNLFEAISKKLGDRPKKPSFYNPLIPQAIESITMRLLEKSPDNRYKNALELSSALEDFLTNNTKQINQHFVIQTRSNPFVGRAYQLSHFEKIINNAFAGNGSIVNIYGDQGVGKSRLLHEWKSIALAKGARFISVESDSKNPLSSLIDQVVAYVTSEVETSAKIIDNAPFLAGLSSKVAQKFKIIPPEEDTEQTSLVLSARNFVEAVFENQTVVIALDEVKDSLLINVLKKLAKNIDKKRMIIVDSTTFASDSAFAATIDQANTLKLEPFSHEEVISCAKIMFGKPLSYESVEKIYNASGGNPQYVIELLTDLGKGSTTIETVPETLKQLFKEKIEKLTDKARLLLDKISILNRPMPFDHLQAIVRMDNDDLAQTINELIAKGLIIEKFTAGQSNIGISSPVIDQVILEESPGKELMRVYNQLATSLEIVSSGQTNIYDGQIGELYIKSGQIDKGAHYFYAYAKRLNDANKEGSYIKEIQKIEPYVSQISDLRLKTNLYLQVLTSKTMQADINGINIYIGILLEMINKNLIPKDLLKMTFLEIAFSFLETHKMEEASDMIDKIKKTFPTTELENDLKY